MTIWRTTVDQLLATFRDALRALVPHVEKVRIEWRDHSAYDDWDQTAQTLYEEVVVSSILWAFTEEEREHCQLPDYNMTYSSYADKTVIAVNLHSTSARFVFHSFAAEKGPFDRVRACRVDAAGQVLDEEFVLLDADVATFRVESPHTALVETAVQV